MKLPFIFVCLFALFIGGCGIYIASKEIPAKKEWRKKGYLPQHFYSCGPLSIKKAFKLLNINKSNSDISMSIQERSPFNNLRSFLSMFHYEWGSITFPEEIKQYLEYNNLEVSEDSFENIKEKDNAIILVRSKLGYGNSYKKNEDTSLNLKSIITYHWLHHPSDDILGYYGRDKTVIIKVFLIRSNNAE